MTIFRPCIDLHAGHVKQIVGGTLSSNTNELRTNFVSKLPAQHFARLYKNAALHGAHVIMLGPGNEEPAREACKEWPGALHVGGGISDENAQQWINWGAGKVIITSYLFPNARFSIDRLKAVLTALGNKPQNLVIDLSCRRQGEKWFVAMNKWQTITDMELNKDTVASLEPYCSEFLIHAADNEGLQEGMDLDLVRNLARWCKKPVTYAGGGKSLQDLDTIKVLSNGKVDLTIGSALDIFGGKTVKFMDCVDWNAKQATSGSSTKFI